MKKLNFKFALVLILFAIAILFTGCKAKSFELSFDVNGGTDIASVTVTKGEDFELPTPTKEGYEFVGWYTNAEFTGEKVTTVSLTEDLKLYAKWEELYKVTLNLDGGTCDKAYVYGKVGDSVASLLTGITPTKSGLTFAGWFVNNTEITSTTKLTSKGVTVTAKYKAEYTINVFKQNLAQDGYEKEEIKLSEIVGKTVNANLDFEGFTLVDKEDSKDSLVVSANKTENVMNVYFDRNTYTIVFRSNYPVEDVEQETTSITVVYGEEITLPTFNYSCEGYYLLGFSETANGEVKYNAHFIDNLAVNQEEKKEVEETKISTSRNMSLYAIWNKGYKDMFGGSDYIFLTDNEGEIYLCRGGVYFVGKVSDNNFLFKNPNADNIQGVLYENGTFAYSNSARDEYSATLYQVGVGLVETVKIYLDEYNGLTYSVTGEDNKTSKSVGTYTIDENGYYVVTFESGELADKTLTMLLGSVTVDNVKTNAFQLRNDDEYDLGIMVRFVINNGQITYYTGAYQILLTGFGTLYYNTGNGTSTYYYTFDSETKVLELKDSNGSSAGVLKVMEVNGKNGYMVYNEALDTEFTSEDGAKLALDGTCNATYTKADGETVTGYYTLESSAFGGYIVKVTNGGKTYTFLTKSHTEEKAIADSTTDEKETVTVLTFEEKLDTYQEYYYKDAEGTYYAPLVVIDDFEAGKASIYGYTKTKTFELVLTGTYTYDEKTKTYSFTTENVNEVEVLTSPIDIAKVKAITFALNTTATSYKINYWYSYTADVTVDGETKEETKTYGVTYTSEDGATLFVIAGLGTLSKDGIVITGQIKSSGEVTTISTASGSAAYVEIYNETKTFITLNHSPYSAYVVKEDGTYSNKTYVTFDGKGNASYVYYEDEVVDGETTSVMKSINGTIQETSELTSTGYKIYQFNSSELTIKYILISTSSATFVFPEYGNYKGNYTSNDGILYLDGFGYTASYTNANGEVVSGIYSVASENVIRVIVNSKYRYFDITGQNFKARGVEYGTYILMDNQGMPGEYIELDGYGVAKVYTMEKDGDTYKQVYVIENASYVIDGSLFTITYTKDSKEIKVEGYLGTYTYNSSTYNTFIVQHEEVVQTFVNEKDWTVLKLDDQGNGLLIDVNGTKVTGTYKIITDSLLYFVNDSATNANIFTYNVESGRIIEAEFTQRGYYTTELNGLLFSQYGFAIFNNETRYYYTMEGNDVIIYHQDPSDANANEYGFVREVFGPFNDVVDYNGKTYYANPGYAITFGRKDDTKDKYPVLVAEETYMPIEGLTFSPSGSDEFSVSGSVYINGKNQTCTVVRVLEEDVYKMYVVVGSYQFEVTCTYQGASNCSYEVVGLKYIRGWYPNNYLNYYYMIYMFYGSSYANSFANNLGYVKQEIIFNEDGTKKEDYIVVDFYEGTDAKDLNGKLLGTKHGTYEQINQSLICVELESTDTYTYKFYFQIQKNKYLSSMYAYNVYAVVRCETLTYGDYTISIERMIYTETSYSVGTVVSMKLAKGEDDLTSSIVFRSGDSWYYVVRTLDENDVITATKYYKIDLVEKDAASMGEEAPAMALYESVTITELSATTIYSSDKKSYIDVIDDKVVLLHLAESDYFPTDSIYDAESSTYTITISETLKYTAKVEEDGSVTITKVVESTEEGN